MSVIEDKRIEELLEEFNDFQFDVDSMIQQSVEILEEQKAKGLLIEGTIEDDEWRFICDTRHSHVYFNFATMREKNDILECRFYSYYSSFKVLDRYFNSLSFRRIT